jgi:hypothetical protein
LEKSIDEVKSEGWKGKRAFQEKPEKPTVPFWKTCKLAAEGLAWMVAKDGKRSNGYQKAGPTRQSKAETKDLQGYYPAKPTPYRLERMMVTDGG